MRVNLAAVGLALNPCRVRFCEAAPSFDEYNNVD